MDFKTYLKVNIIFSLKVAGAVILFCLLFLSSTFNFSAGAFFGTIAFTLSALYHLPQLIKYENNRRKYMKRIRDHEKAVREFEQRRILQTNEMIVVLHKVVESFSYVNSQSLTLAENQFTYMTNTMAITKLNEWNNRAVDIEKVLHASLSRFEEQALLYKRNVLSDDLEQERIHMYIQQSNLPNPYKEILSRTGKIRRYSDKLNEIKEELKEDLKRLKKGLDGENIVRQEIDKYSEDYLSLFGNRIDMGDEGTVENDVLIFSEKGIYTIEVKNIKSEGNQFLKISKDGIWYTRNSIEAEWRHDENSTKIVDQVNRHVYLSQQFLLKHMKERTPIRPIIVISNDNVVIENETTWIIVRPNQIYSIVQQGTDTMDETFVKECYDLFARNDIGEAKFKIRDYNLAIEEVSDKVRFIDHCTEFLSEINFHSTNRQVINN